MGVLSRCLLNFAAIMKIVLIGAGNLATHIGGALQRAGHEMTQVYSRTIEAAAELAEKLGASHTNCIEMIVRDADVYIFAVTDAALTEIIHEVCNGRENGLMLHTSGSTPMDCFRGMAKRYGVLYPLQTFSKCHEIEFTNVPLFIEGCDAQVEREIDLLADGISHNHRHLDSANRRYLHLSAVWACNFVNHCYDIAAGILGQRDIPFDVLLPLIDETAAKVHRLPPNKAQTGPAVRFDENIIRSQAQLMSGDSRLKDLYERMSTSIHQRNKKQQS